MSDPLDEPQWLRRCADPRIFAIACAWLFVLTVLGTVVQGEIGLWQAQERYFSAWLLWLGDGLRDFGLKPWPRWLDYLPLPGGRLTLSITGLSLLSVLFTRRGTRNLGLALLHAGMLLLLGGALVGEALRREGVMALFAGERSDEMHAWHAHELALLVAGEREDRLITVGQDLLAVGATITHPELPLQLVVAERQVNASRLTDGTIAAQPPDLESERNQPGLVLRLPDGRLVGTCEDGNATTVAPGLTAELRRVRSRLPVGIELVHFQRDNHPGTGMAREFSSEVLVHEAGGSRRVVISMNRPLRVGAWTLYQQSYSETSQGVQSVFAVVHDRFRLSPYIASAIMLLGLLLHLGLRLRQRGAA